jgi:hypothetical protein
MMTYIGLDPRFDMEQLGYLPGFLDADDPRPAAEQFDANYVSGWGPQPGWEFDPVRMKAQYPGDPALYPFAMTSLRDEVILFYPHAYVLIKQPDDSFEMARMD